MRATKKITKKEFVRIAEADANNTFTSKKEIEALFGNATNVSVVLDSYRVQFVVSTIGFVKNVEVTFELSEEAKEQLRKENINAKRVLRIALYCEDFAISVNGELLGKSLVSKEEFYEDRFCPEQCRANEDVFYKNGFQYTNHTKNHHEDFLYGKREHYSDDVIQALQNIAKNDYTKQDYDNLDALRNESSLFDMMLFYKVMHAVKINFESIFKGADISLQVPYCISALEKYSFDIHIEYYLGYRIICNGSFRNNVLELEYSDNRNVYAIPDAKTERLKFDSYEYSVSYFEAIRLEMEKVFGSSRDKMLAKIKTNHSLYNTPRGNNPLCYSQMNPNC